MPVSTQHPDYEKHLPEWQMMRDALEGEPVIKAKGVKYLPKTDGQQHLENEQGAKASYLYESYKDRAEYPRWVADALRSMMGLVSRITPEFKAPSGMEYLATEATADGFGIHQLYLRVVREILTTGRVVIAASVASDGRAYAALYPAESAINWKETQQAGRQDLSLLVLEEARDKPSEDEFEHKTETVYRVLDLSEGRYRKRLLDANGELIEEVLPRAMGRPIGYLPVIFAGSTDNAPDVDEVPLLTMAQAAIKAYQLSADYYESLHKTAHPQAWAAVEGELSFNLTGPGTVWQAGEGSRFGYLEITGNGIDKTRQAMQDQRSAALEAGARVVDVGQQIESGDARRARQDDQHASLHSVVVTAAEAVEQFIAYAMELTNSRGEFTFAVKPDFSAGDINPQMATQMLNAALAGVISHESYWEYIRTGKVPDRDYSDEALRLDGQVMSDGE